MDYPEEACEPIVTGKRGAAKITVLQVVLAHPKCKGSVPIDIITTILRLAPHLAELRHSHTGNLPLHAVFYNAFFSSAKRAHIADMIIKANPNSVMLTNYEGKTPLHTNCTQHCNYEPVIALLRAAPQIAKWKDKNGELPLHLACRSQKTPNKSIKTLVDAYPEGIFTRNGQGLTPLEIAKSSKVIQQRKSSRITLLVTLETDYAKTRSEMHPSELQLRHAPHHAQHPHHPQPYGQYSPYPHHMMHSPNQPIIQPIIQHIHHIHHTSPPPKEYERSVMLNPYQTSEILQPRSTPESSSLSTENVMIMESIRSKQGYSTEDVMLMEAYRQKQAYLELIRAHQIVVNPPIKTDELCAESLLALKTKDEA